MSTRTHSSFFLVSVLSTIIAVLVSPGARAQTAAKAWPITSRFVPNDAIALAIWSPADMLNDPQLSMFPIEVMRAQTLDKFGIDVGDVSTVMAVAGVPGPSGPPAGIIVKFAKDYKISDLNPQLLATGEAEEVGEYEAYALNDPPQTYIHAADARTFVVAPEFYLEAIIQADKGTGALPKLVENLPRNAGLTFVAVIEPIRPMLSGYMKQQVAPQLPPPLRPLGLVPEWVDAVLLSLSPSLSTIDFRLAFLCGDEAKAEKLESAFVDSLRFGIDIAKSQVVNAAAGESERVQRATDQYAARVASTIAETIKPTRTGRRVNLNVKSDQSIATTGVLVGLLLPAVQAAREAARRMTASNNLKQLMLAMHNYHAAYGSLPPPAITDDEGKPLLSWRVSLLPFLGEQELYDQFHQDEAWDSPHNLPLSKVLPTFYEDPSAPLPPGYTVFHAVVGDEIGLKSEGKTGFRDFEDGTSNSILLVEASRDAAVPWSKPEDLEIDLEDPLSMMGNTHQNGFHVGLADGAIKFITLNTDRNIFKSLLTRSGGETGNP